MTQDHIWNMYHCYYRSKFTSRFLLFLKKFYFKILDKLLQLENQPSFRYVNPSSALVAVTLSLREISMDTTQTKMLRSLYLVLFCLD